MKEKIGKRKAESGNAKDGWLFDVSVKYRCGTYYARCSGCTASSTNSPSLAAMRAASKFAATIPVPADWTVSTVEVTEELFTVHFIDPNSASPRLSGEKLGGKS